MEEVKIVLTCEEAKLARDVIWSKIEGNRELADYYDKDRIPGWITDEYIKFSKLYNKIQAASYESE